MANRRITERRNKERDGKDMKVYRVFVKEITYLDVEAENGEEAAEIAFAEFNNPDTDAQFDIMGVGVHVMPYDEWMQTGTVVH